MVRIFIFFILLFGGYFIVIDDRETLPSLFAESKVSVNVKTQAYKSVLNDILGHDKVDKKSSVYLVNFWASWCSPCMKELPSLNRLNDLYKDKGLGIITINSDYDEQDKVIKKIIKKLGLSLTVLKDIKGKYTEGFQIEGLPVTILIKNKAIIEKINGEIDFDAIDFREKIDLLLEPSQKDSLSKSM